MQDLRVTLVQANPQWHRINENLEYYSQMISRIKEDTDLIVLPEMFSTGFTMESANMAEEMEGKTHSWMRDQAEKYNLVICGSIVIKEDNSYYNRFLWVEPEGTTKTYDKRHLFRMANENNFFAPGSSQIIINYKDWKIKPMICYDLRFPVWARNFTVDKIFDYDIILYTANWPLKRMEVWKTLLKARAIENYAYSIGVNRVGKDEEGINYNGHSTVFAPDGRNLNISDDTEGTKTVKLNYQDLVAYRRDFPAHMDADGFELDI